MLNLLPDWLQRLWMKSGHTLLLLLLLLLCSVLQQASCSVLESLIAKRTEYLESCNRSLTADASSQSGVFCRGSFDMFLCWPHSRPGLVSVPCPPYLPWMSDGRDTKTQNVSRRAHRECLQDGSWRQKENSSDTWRDDQECQEEFYFKDKEDEMHRHTPLRLVSVIGYSLSLSSLTVAVLLMGVLRKLHCTRNYIHMNLFLSFILRAAAVISKEIISYIMYSNLPRDGPGWSSHSSSAISLMCRFSMVCMEYFVACNYFWLLVEAVFLHTLLFTAVLTKRRLLKKYMLLGWGTPVLFVTPWTVVKILYENKGCWSTVNRGFWWIINGPITLSVLVIFLIFIKILKLLLSKLKADQVKFTDYRYSLARATLVLIPLLGIHEVVFNVLLIDECMEGSSRYARNFINLTLSSFQGFLVAVLYCFANGEVQAELKKRWQLFLFTNHFQVRSCFHSVPLKQLWKRTRTHHQNCSYDEGATSATHPHLLQVAVHGGGGGGGGQGPGEVKGQGLKGGDAAGLDFLTRKSLSSSDGEITLGETVEEILEESQF